MLPLAAESAYPTPLSSSTLLPLLLLSVARQRHSPDGSRTFKDEYDYVIVGGGSAGSVVASRLSELPCVSVLLLEAGTEPPLLLEVPGLGRYFWGTDVDWDYRSAPQRYAGYGYVNRQLPWATAKMLGGGSSLHANLFLRGNRKNYDIWESMGATGWSYNDVFPYFLRAEDNTDPKYLKNGYHAVGGPMTVEHPRYNPRVKRSMYEAIDELGYQIVDANAERQTGFYDHQTTYRDGQRCSTAKGYLVPAENRTNLDIVTEAMVTKVLIRDGEARGVQFDFGGRHFRVKARREVIVSAGAVNTPQLLKLSGIGPADELERLNIPVIADLPVGKNFQNHAGVQYPFVIKPFEPDFDEKVSNPANIEEYISKRSGPLSSSDGYLFLSFLKGLKIFDPNDFPNYELMMSETSMSIIRESGLKPDVFRQFFGPYKNQTVFMCVVVEVQPKSVGEVTLRSKNPYDPPIIQPNYLADPRDLEDIVQGVKNCRRILATKSFQRIGAMPLQTLVPGCEKFAYDEDRYLRCYVRTMLLTYHHPVGTARMGDPSDPTTVLDTKLRVKNVKRLRVIDASVMPRIVSGQTNIPTIMIAEKASDIIKETIDCSGKNRDYNDYLYRRNTVSNPVYEESAERYNWRSFGPRMPRIQA